MTVDGSDASGCAHLPDAGGPADVTLVANTSGVTANGVKLSGHKLGGVQSGGSRRRQAKTRAGAADRP